MSYALGFTIIKYQEGFMFIPGFGSEYLPLHQIPFWHFTSCCETLSALEWKRQQSHISAISSVCRGLESWDVRIFDYLLPVIRDICVASGLRIWKSSAFGSSSSTPAQHNKTGSGVRTSRRGWLVLLLLSVTCHSSQYLLDRTFSRWEIWITYKSGMASDSQRTVRSLYIISW